MILPGTPRPTLWPPKTISSEDYEQLDQALKKIERDEWIDDFIKHLNYTIEEIGRRK
jgi:hypothetical protein